MVSSGGIIGTPPRLQTPLGRYLVQWEQAQLDRLVADIFGYHAVQLGWPVVQGLSANRMPHRWLLQDPKQPAAPLADLGPAAAMPGSDGGPDGPQAGVPLSVLTHFEALPFPSGSIDLAVLPHTLELAQDAHQTLREVERVLVSEGRVVVLGFNPTSLWGAARQLEPFSARFGWPGLGLPRPTETLGPRRLRDWLRLLGFEIEQGGFGCYRPPCTTERWLERCQGLDRAGPRWWPFFGACYWMVAVKRVRAMRLVGPARRARPRVSTAPAVVAQRRPHG